MAIRFLILALLLACLPCVGMETDQFTVPPRPLADIGPEVRDHLEIQLQNAADEGYRRFQAHIAEAAQTTDRRRQDRLVKEAAYYLTGDFLSRSLRETVGSGLPETALEKWFRKHTFRAQPATFEIPFGQSIYAFGPLDRPLALTVNLYGVYQGTDKIAHMLEQGQQYFTAYHNALDDGHSESEALRRALKVGVDQEKGIYGQWVSGVYSNADLAANYAGFKLHLNLTRAVTIDGRRLEPIMVLVDNHWRLNPRRDDDWLAPFITPHLDESLNPSFYTGLMPLSIRPLIEQRLDDWYRFHNTSPARESKRLPTLSRWHGEAYGHSGFRKLITPAPAPTKAP